MTLPTKDFEWTAATETSSSTLRRAFGAIDQLQRELEAAKRVRSEPIAIVGVGCRFPGGVVDPDSYWRLLESGTDAISEVPRDRWNVDAFYGGATVQPGKMTTRWGGFVDGIDEFDPAFFGISPREAEAMDPQQRLVLEVAWEALESAGQSHLAGSRSGVFVGVVTNDYGIEKFSHPLDVDAYAATGTAHSILAGRLSYVLDLRGPAVAVDTACSSSLVAIHLACQSLRAGDCDLALGGGVNVLVSPLPTIAFSQFGMMAPDGRCRTFDARANGFVRGEGCGMVVLKRLSDALADGDDVLAVIRGSAINQDGRSTGLTAPNVLSQRDLLRRALEQSGVEPRQVSYVEAHGTATALGDPIEVEALSEVYGAHPDGKWHLGSVKTNFGHLEGAAGVAGLIKVVLSLRHRAIPAHLHFEQLNSLIALEEPPFVIPTRLTPWAARDGRRIAGVSSFGLSGTNVHLIVEEAPARAKPLEDTRRPLSILALSAKSDSALDDLARKYREHLGCDAAAPVADVCFSANTGRHQFRHRLALVGGSRKELCKQLDGYLARGSREPASTADGRKADVAFLFSGQGEERPGMARALYETQPAFRRALERCDELLRPLLPAPLLTVLFASDPGGERLDAYAQPALFAVEYALAELWRSWGVEPAAVLGHGVGEYVAACVAGVMSLESGLRLAAERGRLAPGQPSDRATPGVEAALDPLRRAASGVVFERPRTPWVSSLSGALWAWDEAPDAEYWCRQARMPVRFPAAVETLRVLGCTRFLEVGPSPALLTLVHACGPSGELLLPSLRRGDDDGRVLLSSLAELYMGGTDVDWKGFDRDFARSRVSVPTYPFQRARYWVDSRRREDDAPDAANGAEAGGEALLAAAATGGPAAEPANDAGTGLTRGALLALPAEDRLGVLASHLQRGVVGALSSGAGPRRHGRRAGMPDSAVVVDLDRSLFELGLDSLMATGLRNQIRIQLGVTLPITAFLHGASVREIAGQILARVLAGEEGVPEEAAPIHRVDRAGDGTEELFAELERLSEEEARQQLAGKG
jgi:acyl transferase domain-containing protein